MKGIAAAPGMALARAHIVSGPDVVIEEHSVTDASGELARLRHAVSECHSRLEGLIGNLEGSVDPQTVEILDFQLLLLEDTDFIGKIESIVSDRHINSEYAVKESSDWYIAYLEGLTDNDYLRERAADVSDLSQRLIAVLSGVDSDISEPDEAYIAIGEDITPSRVAELDKSKLKGIILEKGGITSHCVILSKSLGIPCLIETSGILGAAKAGGTVLLDAVTGKAVMNPDNAQVRAYNEYAAAADSEKMRLMVYISRESRTQDGAEVKVYANITEKSEAEELVRQGGEGAGLFRTELLFMSQTGRPPSEEEQYAEYAEASKALDGRPLIIRTLDIGGDKQIGYMDIGKEENPFLGYRAIRFCLDHPEIFKPQISAILRAGAVGNVWMMFPMVTNKTELLRAKEMVAQVKEELKSQGKLFDPDMKTGIMIETPAAAFDAEILAKEADFFSIGTNDLTQYLFAADRTNSKVAGLNSHFQPGLLRVIYSVVRAAHKAGIEADICGQAAEIDSLVPLWVAMGVDNLSVSIPRITAVRERICSVLKSKCDGLLNTVLRLDSADEVERTLCGFINN